MPVERSAGVILFRNTPEGRRYLVLRSSVSEAKVAAGKTVPEFWDFPKGRLDGNETGIEAARRETYEEAGIDAFEITPEFKETVRYFTWRTGKPVPKFVAMFLAETKTDAVRLSWEHDAFEWLPYEAAHRQISLIPMKKALAAAEKFLNR